MNVGILTSPSELNKGDIVSLQYMIFHFDFKLEDNTYPMDMHHLYDNLLFHHTLKGFELIDDNYLK